MSDVAASVDVRVPVRTAYNQWTQFESFPQFMTGVVAVRQLNSHATHWVTEIGGAHREFDAEIVEQRPDERIVWQSTDGDLQHSGTVTFQPISSQETRVTVDLAWEPQGMVEKVGSTIGVDQMQVKRDLQKFKEFIEDHGAETSSTQTMSTQTTETQYPGMQDAPLHAPLHSLMHSPPQPQPTSLPPSYDVVDVLRTQHEQIKRMLAQTESATGPAKEQHFRDLLNLLELHEKGERQVVHPVTRSTGAAGDRTAADRIGEERKAEEMITGLKMADVGSPDFNAQFTRLRYAVLRHAQQEETEEFPRLRRDVAPEQLRAMAEQLLALQSSLG